MTKTPLTERMEKAKAPKTWIREVKTKDNRIERLFELLEEYLNIIDLLAREKEQLETENGALSELLSHLVNIELERDKLKEINHTLKEMVTFWEQGHTNQDVYLGLVEYIAYLQKEDRNNETK